MHTVNPFGFTEYLFGTESDNERKTLVDFNAAASIKLLSHLTSPKSLLQSEISKLNAKTQED